MFKKLTVLVTGGASGLGRATAERLARDGARVLICDLPTSKGNELVESLGKENAIFVPTDVSKESEVENAVNVCESEFGGLDLAVCCAGIGVARKTLGGKPGAFKPHPMGEFLKALEVNLLGTINVNLYCVKSMLKNARNEDNLRGTIINTASVAAFDGQMGQVAYSASKMGIVSYTKVQAKDLMGEGIRSIAIAPGLFQTPLLAGLPPKVQNELTKTVPFPSRLGHPDEFASLVVSILNCSFINGTTIRLDGALRMQ